MIDLFGNKSQEIANDDKVMEQMRELISNKESYKNKRVANFVYAASTALAAVVLVIGVTTLNNYDKMENMEEKLNHISANIEENNLVVETITGTVQKENEHQLENDNKETENGQEKIKENEEENLEETNIEQLEKEEEGEPTIAEGNYYIVKKGDTLVTISGRLYGSDEYVEEIQKLNQIENRDMIYEGQQLIVPKVQ